MKQKLIIESNKESVRQIIKINNKTSVFFFGISLAVNKLLNFLCDLLLVFYILGLREITN